MAAMSTLVPLRKLLHFFWPSRCPFCGEIIPAERRCCSRCKNSLACDHPAFFLDGLDACFAFADYSHEAAQAVHRLKFQNQPQLARVFAILMAQHLGPALLEEEPDLLCGVAMHTKRKRKRGYNQAQLIAQELAKQLHLPCQQLLEKTAATAAQHTLSAAERRTNLQGVYRVLDKQQVSGKRILLVDDVITTGSTMLACAQALRQAGAHLGGSRWLCTSLSFFLPGRPRTTQRFLTENTPSVFKQMGCPFIRYPSKSNAECFLSIRPIWRESFCSWFHSAPVRRIR